MQKFFLALSCFLLTGQIWAKSSIHIDVGLSAGSFQIKSDKVKGSITKKGDLLVAEGLSVKVSTLKTGIELRDKHLHQRLLPEKFPKIEILEATGQNGKGKGTISIRGIKKPFNFNYEAKQKLIIAKFKLSLKEFQIADLKYMGIGVEDEISLIAEIDSN